MDALLWLVAVALVLLGALGTVLPALPGPPMVFGGLLLAAWINDFQSVGWVTVIALGLLTAFAQLVDVLATSYGARRMGASWPAVAGAALGGLVGLFIGLPGLVFGPFAGAVAGQFLTSRSWLHAGRVGFGTWIGLVLAAAVRLTLVVLMIGLFVTAYLV